MNIPSQSIRTKDNEQHVSREAEAEAEPPPGRTMLDDTNGTTANTFSLERKGGTC